MAAYKRTSGSHAAMYLIAESALTIPLLDDDVSTPFCRIYDSTLSSQLVTPPKTQVPNNKALAQMFTHILEVPVGEVVDWDHDVGNEVTLGHDIRPDKCTIIERFFKQRTSRSTYITNLVPFYYVRYNGIYKQVSAEDLAKLQPRPGTGTSGGAETTSSTSQFRATLRFVG